MAKYTVYWETVASTAFEAEFDDAGMTPDEIEEKAIDITSAQAYVSLCHQCAHEVDLGDLEPAEEPLSERRD